MGIKIVSVEKVDEEFLKNVFKEKEPLKNKKKNKFPLYPNVTFYDGEDVKSAVEWLKDELKKNMMYLHRGDETYLFKQINEAFSDVVIKS